MLWVDVEDGSGNVLGEGPLGNVLSWESKELLSQAGTFACDLPLTDPRTSLVQHHRRLRCWDIVGGVAVSIGAGIVHKTKLDPIARLLHVEGPNLLYELTHTHVGGLVIDDGAGGATLEGPQIIMAYAPAGWTLDTVNGHDETLKAILHTFEGETVLAALVKLVELTGERFRLGTGRKLVWMQADTPDAELVATNIGDPLSIRSASDRALLTALTIAEDSFETGVGRLYAYGVGIGDVRITLDGASCSYTGYTLGADGRGWYLEHTATWSAYRIERYRSFKDIENSQTLLEAAYELMRSQVAQPAAYELGLADVGKPLDVGGLIRVQARETADGRVMADVDETLNLLEVTTKVDAGGRRTVALKVANVDRLPKTEGQAMVGAVANSQSFYTHPQPVSGGAHKSSHQNGGGDEIHVGGLSGVLADPQTPAAHTHPLGDLQEPVARWRGAGASAPGSPQEGDLWDDTGGGGDVVKIYTNGGWRALS